MRSLFEKNLLRMKSELTDLKTAQKRGVGTIRFYSITKQVTVTAGTQTTITATLAADGYFPGFAILRGGPFYGMMTATEDNLTYQATVTSSRSFTFPLTFTSSTPIESMEVA